MFPSLFRTTRLPHQEYIANALHILAHHGNHEVEESDSLNEGEAKNGVGEQLPTHAGVAGNSRNEGCEDHTDTDTGSCQSDSGRAHSQVLGDLNHGIGDLRGVCSAASGGVEDLGYLLTLHGLEGRVGANSMAGTYVTVNMCPSEWLQRFLVRT
jgi:hypothetical protein